MINRSQMLDGVPRLGFDVHMSPFPGSLAAALTYMGDPADYDYIMGTTGACFRRLWNRDDGGNIDLSYFGDAPFERVFWALGYAWEKVPAEKDAMIAGIKRGLAAGRPPISFGILGPPEAGLVAGCAEEGAVLYGWSYFQAESGHKGDVYYETRAWFDTMDKNAGKGLILIGEKLPERPAAREVLRASLEWAVKLETTARWPTLRNHVNGLAALDAWADALEVDADFPVGDPQVMGLRVMVHGDQCTMMVERHNAAGFLRAMAAAVPGLAPETVAQLQAAADCFDATECMDVLWPWSYDMGEDAQRGLADPAWRRTMAARLREVRVKEAEAVGHMEMALRGV